MDDKQYILKIEDIAEAITDADKDRKGIYVVKRGIESNKLFPAIKAYTIELYFKEPNKSAVVLITVSETVKSITDKQETMVWNRLGIALMTELLIYTKNGRDTSE